MRQMSSVLDFGDKEKAEKALKEMVELLEYYADLHPTGKAAHWLQKKDEERGLTCR